MIKNTLAPGITVYKIDPSDIVESLNKLDSLDWVSEYVVDANDGNKALDDSYRNTKSIDIPVVYKELGMSDRKRE